MSLSIVAMLVLCTSYASACIHTRSYGDPKALAFGHITAGLLRLIWAFYFVRQIRSPVCVRNFTTVATLVSCIYVNSHKCGRQCRSPVYVWLFTIVATLVSCILCEFSQMWQRWSPVYAWIFTLVATLVLCIDVNLHTCGNVGLLYTCEFITIVAMLVYGIHVNLHNCGSVGPVYKCDWIFTIMTPFGLLYSCGYSYLWHCRPSCTWEYSQWW